MNGRSVQKTLKIYNSTIINAILIKLTTSMYLRETFYLAKYWGVTHRAQDSINKKHLQMSQKFSFSA